MSGSRLTRFGGFAAASLGVLLAGAFTLWALTSEVYSSVSLSSSGGVTSPHSTLLEQNPGPVTVIAVVAPLLLAMVCWMALQTACRHESKRWRNVGMGIALVLMAFSLITGFSIGMALMPAALALVIGAALTPVRGTPA